MFDNPAIPADILTVLFIGLILVVLYAVASTVLHGMAAMLAHRRAKRREPETFGDSGGMPADGHQSRRAGDTPAPEIGFGPLAGSDQAFIETWPRRVGDWPDSSSAVLTNRKRAG